MPNPASARLQSSQPTHNAGGPFQSSTFSDTQTRAGRRPILWTREPVEDALRRVPFSRQAYAGFGSVKGLISLESPELVLEFETCDAILGVIKTSPKEIRLPLSDIESLNQRALKGELEVTAVSIHAYAHLHRTYALLSSGSSMGDGYGPRLVSRSAAPADARAAARGKRIAVPGKLTTAYLALRLFQPDFVPMWMAFDQIDRQGMGEGDRQDRPDRDMEQEKPRHHGAGVGLQERRFPCPAGANRLCRHEVIPAMPAAARGHPPLSWHPVSRHHRPGGIR